MYRKPLSVMFALVAAMSLSQAFAEEKVTRKREKPLSGEVTGVTKTEVTIKIKTPKEETVKLPANDVISIAWTGESPECNLARADENGGRYQKAIDGYLKAVQSGKSPNPLAKTELELAIARTTAKMALVDPAKLDEAIKKLEEFRDKQRDHYGYYEVLGILGQLYAAKKDMVKAKVAFDTLGKAPWKESQMASRVALGRLALADNRLDDAAAEYAAVLAMSADGALEESQRQEAVLGQARVLIAQKKFEEALKLLDEVIAKAPPEDMKVNAEAFIRKGDCLREQGSDKDALLAYLAVDILFSSERSLHAEALYRLTSLWEKVGQKPRADDARERLKSDYENSEWAAQLKAPTGG